MNTGTPIKNRSIQTKIAIGAVLILIVIFVFPALKVSHGHPPWERIKTDINAIVTAIKSYDATYGELPWSKSNHDMLFCESNVQEYNTLFELLTCADTTDTERTHVKNSRNIKYLDYPTYYKEKGFLDNLGNRFKIYLDTNYDGKVNVEGKNLNGSVFVYSYGRNGFDDKSNKDDICSWK